MKRFKLIFAWYDIWVGFFYDKKKAYLYFFPVPMFGVIFKLNPFREWMNELKQIAEKWSADYIGMDWQEDYFKDTYYSIGMTPQQAWQEYTTKLK